MTKQYLHRHIDQHLLDWKNDPQHKPLLLRGARQVGKSSAVRHLAAEFDYFVEVNFERDRMVNAIFQKNLSTRQIAQQLSMLYTTPVVAGQTLLFLDEIQACPEAIRSLWFFYEDFPELHVVAAGSLLEFALKDLSSFGVGRVRSMFMRPMSFDEFLAAMGNTPWIEAKKSSGPEAPIVEPLHQKLVDSFRNFLLVGGMPEVVSHWIRTSDFGGCQKIQDDIIISYEDDFAKYSKKADPTLLRQTLCSVAQQIGNKFVLSNVQGDYRSERIKETLELLRDAGLIIPAFHTAANGLPLGAEINEKFVKYLFADSGLLLRLQGLENIDQQHQTERLILLSTAEELVNKGSITEMTAGLELLKYSSPTQKHDLYYWQNLSRGAQAEVDYVVAKNSKVVPIEVKSGTRGSMKSLYKFLSDKGLDYGIRASLENFGRIDNVDIIPLYALSNIAQ